MNESRIVDPIVDPKPQEAASETPASRFEGQTVGEMRVDPNEFESIRSENENLKKKLGQQGNEIGELRRAVEQYTVRQPVQEPEPVDYLDDPEAATKQQLDPIRAELEQLKTQNLRAELRAKHSDFEQVIATPAFAEWVKADPLRMIGYQEADNGDLNIADRLLSEYKQEVSQGGPTEQVAQRQRRASAASGERATGKSEPAYMFSSRELQNMKAFNPQRYQELLPKIRQAYDKGLVKRE